jgi:hypothetical protein
MVTVLNYQFLIDNLMNPIGSYRELRAVLGEIETTKTNIVRLRIQILGRPGRAAAADITTYTDVQLQEFNQAILTFIEQLNATRAHVDALRENNAFMKRALIDAKTAKGPNPNTIIQEITTILTESTAVIQPVHAIVRHELQDRANIRRLQEIAAREAAERDAAEEAERERQAALLQDPNWVAEQAEIAAIRQRFADLHREREGNEFVRQRPRRIGPAEKREIEAVLRRREERIEARAEAERQAEQARIEAQQRANEEARAVELQIQEGPDMPIPTKLWKGFSKGDLTKLNSVFITHIPQNSHGRAEKEMSSVCPICLSYAERAEGCIYAQGHNCKREAQNRGDGLYHRELYNKYKNPGGSVVFCFICSRICQNAPEKHIALATHDAPRGQAILTDADPFARGDVGCIAAGGGGFREKVVRFNVIRNTAMALRDQIGQITHYDAFRQIVEAAWDAPLYPAILRNNRFNIKNNNIPENQNNTNELIIPRNGFETPTILMEGANTVAYIDDPPLIQFHHLDSAGNMHHHEDKLAGLSGLMTWIKPGSYGEERYTCFSQACNGYLYPREIALALFAKQPDGTPYFALTTEQDAIVKDYKKRFNSKFKLSDTNNVPSLSGFFNEGDEDSMFHPIHDLTYAVPNAVPNAAGGSRRRFKSRKQSKRRRQTRRRN